MFEWFYGLDQAQCELPIVPVGYWVLPRNKKLALTRLYGLFQKYDYNSVRQQYLWLRSKPTYYVTLNHTC